MNKDQLTLLLNAQQHVIEKIALGSGLDECLTCVCEKIELVIGSRDARSSILLLKGNQLRHGAAPRLPKAYCEAIDGVVIGPSVGSCGTAAYTGEQVIVSDIEHDPRWGDFKSFALEHDLRACWSTPILSSKNQILGTFAIYYPCIKKPTEAHLSLISLFTHLSSFAIEKQQNEAEIRDSENYRRTLFETSPIGLALCRKDGTLVDINPAFAAIIGRSVDETLGLLYWDITPEKFREQELFQVECLEARGTYGPYEKEYIHKHGHLVPVRLSGMYLERNGEQFIWSSVEDITQQKLTEEALRRSQKMDAIGQLTGGIAHDFNNILGIILGHLSLLERDLVNNEKAKKRISNINKASQRAVDLTKQLLSCSRKEEISIKLEPTNINRLIQRNFTLITRSVTPVIKVEHHLSDEVWLTDVSSGDFEDVLLNLILNARDAMPDGGTLTLETCNCTLDATYCAKNPGFVEGEFVQLIVSDTGIGIPVDLLERIFEPFFTTKGLEKGTGLGLAMVYGFIKRCKGHVNVSSELGKGTTFHMYLPRSKEKEQFAGKVFESREVIQRGDETILAVDDEEGLVELAKEYLQAFGYRVLVALDSKQALTVLAENPSIDLLFSDVVMPGDLSGYDLAMQVSQKYPELKVLLTSGYTEKAISKNSRTHTNFDLLSKPYSQAELAMKVRLVLGKWKPKSLIAEPSTLDLNNLTNLLTTGIKDIDDDHQELVNLLGKCLKLNSGESECEQVDSILEELMEYTQRHFKYEEALMEACDYPDRVVHTRVHELLIKQVRNKQKKIKQGLLSIKDVVSFLTSWWEEHINVMDRAFIPYCEGKEALIKKKLDSL